MATLLLFLTSAAAAAAATEELFLTPETKILGRKKDIPSNSLIICPSYVAHILDNSKRLHLRSIFFLSMLILCIIIWLIIKSLGKINNSVVTPLVKGQLRDRERKRRERSHELCGM